MILVDVDVPALDRVFDLELDEETRLDELKEKIVTLITQKELLSGQRIEEMLLYALWQEKILNGELTLKQQGIKSGDRLILI